MSSYLSVAVVTATLQRLLQEAMQDIVPGVTVRVGPPRTVAPAALAEVNVCLYQTLPNLALRNQDLPTRLDQGSILQRPTVALDLHYLISFVGEQDLAAERMFGKAATVLHAYPILGPKEFATTAASGGSFGYLAASSLAADTEGVRLVPNYPSLEELSKLWTVFSQVTHRLSLQYVAGPVLLEADVTPIASPLLRRWPFTNFLRSRESPRVAAVEADEKRERQGLTIGSKRDV